MGTEHSFLANLEWRRAVKRFDDGPVDTTQIIRAMINAPSSFGLQPQRIIAVRSKELKDALKPVSQNQPQVSECHTLFVICARKDVDDRAEEYLTATGTAASLGPMLKGFLSQLPDKLAWAQRQAQIALGQGLAAATEARIASCPMEGFSSAEVAKILELPENLVPTAYLAVGEEHDEGAPQPRFRFSEEDLIQERN